MVTHPPIVENIADMDDEAVKFEALLQFVRALLLACNRDQRPSPWLVKALIFLGCMILGSSLYFSSEIWFSLPFNLDNKLYGIRIDWLLVPLCFCMCMEKLVDMFLRYVKKKNELIAKWKCMAACFMLHELFSNQSLPAKLDRQQCANTQTPCANQVFDILRHIGRSRNKCFVHGVETEAKYRVAALLDDGAVHLDFVELPAEMHFNAMCAASAVVCFIRGTKYDPTNILNLTITEDRGPLSSGQIRVRYDDSACDYAFFCSLKVAILEAQKALRLYDTLDVLGKIAASYTIAIAVRACFRDPRPIDGTLSATVGDAVNRAMSWILHLGKWDFGSANPAQLADIRQNLMFNENERIALNGAFTKVLSLEPPLPPLPPVTNNRNFASLNDFWTNELDGGPDAIGPRYWRCYANAQVRKCAAGQKFGVCDV